MVVRRILKALLGRPLRPGQTPLTEVRVDYGVDDADVELEPDVPDDAAAWPAPTEDSPAVILHLGSGKEVSGESHYQPPLLKAAGVLTPEGVAAECRLHMVELAAEPDNPHDARAIRVLLAGELVGYIPRESTVLYHPLLHWAARQRLRVLCRSHLVGGFVRYGGERATLGIRLDHTSPPVVQYDGKRPTLVDPRSSGRPTWGEVAVTGEEKHQDFLESRLFLMNCAELIIQDDAVQVEVDGQRIGRLTPKMSTRYVSGLTKHIDEFGEATAFCRLSRGNTKIEARVQLPTGHELATWELGI